MTNDLLKRLIRDPFYQVPDLEPAQREVLKGLARGESVGALAKQLKVNLRTVYRITFRALRTLNDWLGPSGDKEIRREDLTRLAFQLLEQAAEG